MCQCVYTIHTNWQLSTANMSESFLQACNLLDLWPWIKEIHWQKKWNNNPGRSGHSLRDLVGNCQRPLSSVLSPEVPRGMESLTYRASVFNHLPFINCLCLHTSLPHCMAIFQRVTLSIAWGWQLEEFRRYQSLFLCFISLCGCEPSRAQAYEKVVIYLRLHLLWYSNISIFKT